MMIHVQVFLVAMLELLARYGRQVPDVDFVLQPADRAKIAKAKNPMANKVISLSLRPSPSTRPHTSKT